MSLARGENGVPTAAVEVGGTGSAPLVLESPGAGVAPRAFQDVLAGMAEAVVLTDARDLVQWWNRAAHDLLPELRPETALTPDCWGAWAEPRESPQEFDLGGRHVQVRTQELADGWTCWYLNDVTVQRRRENMLLAERARQALLARAGRLFAATLSAERLLRSALELLFEHGVRRCAVVFVDGEQDVMLGRWEEERPTRWEPSPFRPLRGDHQVVRLEGDPRGPAEWFDAVSSFELRTYGDPFGMLLVPAGEHVDHELFTTFAGQLAANLHVASLHRRRGHHAKTLRNSLTQRELPQVEGAELAAAYRAAEERDRIGGDFYEVTPSEGGGWSFALGDVCGKGVEAAVLSGQTRHVLHAASFLDLGPAARLDLLNKVICSEQTRRFVTLITGDLDVEQDGRLTLRFANGGHPRPVVLPASGEPREVPPNGMLVGALEQARFSEADVVLAPGETMLLYTDGVTEARDPTGDFYGTERLLRLLRECAGLSAAAIAAYVEQDVFEFLRGESHDDVAVLAIRAAGAPGAGGELW